MARLSIFSALGSICLCLAALVQPSQAHPASPPLAKVTLSLLPQDETLLERTLYQLADPLHQRHGKYLSRQEALDLLKPHSDTVSSVKRWLHNAGIKEQDMQLQGQLLHVIMPEPMAASLFNTTDDAATTASKTRRADEYVSLGHIQPYIRALHVRKIAELDTRASFYQSQNPEHEIKTDLHLDKHTVGGLNSCNDKVTPACIRKLYQISDISSTSKRASMAVVGFSQQTAQHSQLAKFLNSFDPAISNVNFTDVLINGGTNPQGNNYASGEANLDIQYAVALAAANVNVHFYSVGGKNLDYIPDLDVPKNNFTEPYLDLALALVSLPNAALPSVVSISYGINEQLLPFAYAQHVCDLFGQLATRGVSVIVSSGDAGPGQSCQTNDGSKRERFLPTFPATCPYVTAVGATIATFQANGERKDEVASQISGGGFSEHFPQPAFQRLSGAGDLMDRYVKKQAEKWPGYFNEGGRAIPDVAAVGDYLPVYNHEHVENGSGTSASAPIFAAMIAVLNSLRAQKGKPTLGFLNPWLYKHARVGFNDITTGKSQGCNGGSNVGLPSPHIPNAGWPADEGWDAVTGLGTPIFSKLRKLACV